MNSCVFINLINAVEVLTNVKNWNLILKWNIVFNSERQIWMNESESDGVSAVILQAKDMQKMVKLEEDMDRRPATVV